MINLILRVNFLNDKYYKDLEKLIYDGNSDAFYSDVNRTIQNVSEYTYTEKENPNHLQAVWLIKPSVNKDEIVLTHTISNISTGLDIGPVVGHISKFFRIMVANPEVETNNIGFVMQVYHAHKKLLAIEDELSAIVRTYIEKVL